MKVSRCLNHGKKRWRVTWRVGSRTKRKFFAIPKAARDFARDALREQKQFGREWIALSELDRAELVRCWHQAKERGYQIAEACRFFEANGRQTASGVTVSGLCAKFLAAKLAKGLRRESLRLLEVTLEQFKFGREEQRAASITTGEVSDWLSSQGGWGPWRRRGAIIDLANMFNWAVNARLMLHNPVAGIERPIIDDKTPEVLSVERAKAILQICRKKHRKLLPWLAISLFAGLRESEVRRLSWSDVRRDSIVLAGHQTKGRARRIVAITPALKAWLAVCRKGKGSICGKNHHKFACEFRKRCGGLPRNVLRHSFISYAIARTNNVQAVALEAGNSPEIIFKHYREVVTAEEAAKFWELKP